MLVTDKSLGEDWPMCPKHGIAHGVCVDPVDASDTTSASCTFCGKPVTTGHVCLIDPPEPILAPGVTLTPNSNRFDPYEALDKIRGFICNFGANSAAQAIVENQLHALRAYITGMEK